MTLLRLLVRHQRRMLVLWTVLLLALIAGTVSSYQSSYRTVAARRAATELAQHNSATTLLYGRLADPGTPAQMFTWEMGAYLTILAAILGVLVAISASRASEDNGPLELARVTGVTPAAPLRAAIAMLVAVGAALALGSAVALGVYAGHIDGVTWTGAAGFGAVLGLTFLLIGSSTLVIAQVAPTAASARRLAFAAVGVAFAIRACADLGHIGWLEWLSPLALRETIGPFTELRWWALSPYIALVAALAVLALHLQRRRDFAAGLIRARETSDARLHTRTCLDLTIRLGRRSVLIWTTWVALLGTLLCAIGSGAVHLSGTGRLHGFLGSQLQGSNPVAAYFSYTATIVGIIVSVFVILTVTEAQHSERDGYTDQILATGARRWTPLGSQTLLAAAGSLLILGITGALSALVAPHFIAGDAVALRAFGYMIGQWPATLAVTGFTALLVAAAPNATWLAWLPAIISAVLSLLGRLLGLSQQVRDLGLYGHVPDLASSHPHVNALVTLAGIGAFGTCLALALIPRRDIIVTA